MKSLLYLFFISLLFSCSDKEDPLRPDSFSSEPFGANDISLSAESDSIGANGTSYAEVVLTVSPRVLDKYKEASFEIAPVGKFSNGATQMKTALDAAGKARVFISSTMAGVGYIKAATGTLTATTVVRFGKVENPVSLDTLILEVRRDSIAADNYSYAEVVAITKYPGAIASRQVKFTTDKGSFSNDAKEYTVNFGADSVARAFIRHNRAEPVRITATVNNNYSRELYVRFVPSWPGQLLIEPDAATLPPLLTSTTAITARLLRSEGVVSEGQVVHFYDSTAANRSVGIFVNTTRSNSSGVATTRYFLQDTSFRGLVYIKGYVQTDTGRVMGVNRILIQ